MWHIGHSVWKNLVTKFIFCIILQEEHPGYTSDGTVDFNRQPALKQSTGKWRACFFILGNTRKVTTNI
jgi:hypothetical protein